MPPRRLSKCSEFIHCTDCNVIFYKDIQNHATHCEYIRQRNVLDNDDDTIDLNWKLKRSYYSYISGNGFFSEVEYLDFTSEDFKNYPKSSIVMHPSVMKLCKINIFSPVVVCSQKLQSVHIAMPSKAVKKKMSVYINKHCTKHKPKDKIIVFPYVDSIPEAKVLVIQSSCTQCQITDLEKKLILYNLCDKFVHTELQVKKPFSKTCCKLIITNIHTAQAKTEETDNLTKHELSSMSQLISDISSINVCSSELESEIKSKCYSFDGESSIVEKYPKDARHSLSLSNQFSFFDCSSNDLLEEISNSLVPIMNRKYLLHNYFHVTNSTTLITSIDKDLRQEEMGPVKCINFKNIGGLHEQISLIRDFVESLFNPKSSIHRGSFPYGVLLCGASGTGKSLLVNALRNEYREINYQLISASEIYCKYLFNNQNILTNVFKHAWERFPSIIVIDELDILCEMFPCNKGGIVKSLDVLMDKSKEQHQCLLVLAIARNVHLVDKSLRSTDRFDNEIKFSMPDIKERSEILTKSLENISHQLCKEEIYALAEEADGFTGLNLCQIISDAHLARSGKDKNHDSPKNISYTDLLYQLKLKKANILRSERYQVQKVHWKDIGGMLKVKTKLKQIVVLPLKYPEIFKRFNVAPPRGILLYGPPGCSKTLIAKALATETNLNFIPVKGPELLSKWVGESEKAVRNLFKKAKEAAPCIIFFDEVDALVAERGSSDGSDVGKRVVTQILTEVDGAEQLQNVIIVAATNRPDILDPAMLRPGRLDYLIYVPLPDCDTRKEIFQLMLKSMPVSEAMDIEALVCETAGYSGAEIVAVCQEAGLIALSENWPEIVNNPIVRSVHFHQAMRLLQPRIPPETIEFYEAFNLATK